jgi:hypothetical protein
MSSLSAGAGAFANSKPSAGPTFGRCQFSLSGEFPFTEHRQHRHEHKEEGDDLK